MSGRKTRLLAIAALCSGLVLPVSCGTPTYYSSSTGYYGTSGWYDPYCCRGGTVVVRPPHHRPRPPGYRPRPPGGRPPGMRPPMPSRPRPTPRPARRR